MYDINVYFNIVGTICVFSLFSYDFDSKIYELHLFEFYLSSIKLHFTLSIINF